MTKKLPTGISSRKHEAEGKVIVQYRARLQDPSRRTPKGTLATKSSRYFEKMADAKAWLEEQRKLLNQYGSLHVDKLKTVGEACREWIAEARKSGINGRKPIEDATWQRYRSTLENVIVGSIDLVRIAELRPAMVSRWVKEIAVIRTGDSAHRALSLVKMVLDNEIVKETVMFNAAATVNISKRSADNDDDCDFKTVTEFMSSQDIAKLLKAADTLAGGDDDRQTIKGLGKHQRAQRAKSWAKWRPLVYTLVATGVRIGEASAIQWKHIDLELGVIHVCQALKRNGSVGKPKTQAGDRHIPIEAELVQILRQLKESVDPTDNEFVFGNGANPMSPGNFARRGWAPMMILAGLVDEEDSPLWSRHDCRHYHASFLILAGYPESQVAERLGHSDVNVTRKVYLHLFKEMAGHANRIGADLEQRIFGRPVQAIESKNRAMG